MRSLIKTQILVLITIILLLSLTSISSIAETLNEHTEKRITILQDVGVGGSQLIPVNFYFHQNQELTPQLPKEGKSDNVATCPNGFKPARWSIFGRFGSVEWRDVGSWKTIQVNKALQAAGIVRFRIWVSYIGSGSPNGNFEFYWKRNEENIAEAKNVQIGFSNGMPPTLVEISAPLINQTPFQIGDVFSVYVRCRNNFDGAQILYGSREHSTALVMNCDPLSLIHLHADEDCVKGIYDDIFKVRPTDMTFEAKVDNVVIDTIPTVDSEKHQDMFYNSVRWKTKIEPGNHDVEVRISYGGMDNTTVVTLAQQIKIKAVPIPMFLGLEMWIWHLIFTLVAVGITIYIVSKVKSHYDEKKWLEEQGLK
jgi:hypothetical protein